MMELGIYVVLVLVRFVYGNEMTPSPGEITSCYGRCDEQYFPGYQCYCNNQCDQFENCCYDYYPECDPDGNVTDAWVNFEGHSYRFFQDNTITSDAAKRVCVEEHQAMLVSLNSQLEQNFITFTLLGRRTFNVFIGGSDSGKEGVWRWYDGTRMPLPTDLWSSWFSGKPDNTGDCAVLGNYIKYEGMWQTLTAYYWLDYSCKINAQEIQGYICERTLACEPNPCENNGTCYYVEGEEEFWCECAAGYLGVVCDSQLIEGAKWTRCGETNLTGSSGEIISPLYPRHYPPNTDCLWSINVGTGRTIAFRIEMLNLETSKDCVFDSLTISDGGDDSGDMLIGPVCGNLTDDLRRSITTSGPEAIVTFITDSSLHETGFKLSYKADTCGRGVGESGCRTPKDFTTSCGRVTVEDGPSNGNDLCHWFITVPPGSIINVTITDFNIPDNGEECGSESLVFYDGTDPVSAPVIERACGRRLAWSVLSSTNQLRLVMKGVMWEQGVSSIIFQYDTIDSGSWRMVNPMSLVAGDRGEFASSNPFSLHIQTATINTYTWLVKVEIGQLLSLNWTLTSYQLAYLKIFDGHSESSQMIVDVSTTDMAENGRVEATTFQLLVKVVSTRGDSRMIFRASYKSSAWPAGLSGCYRPLYSSRKDSLETENSVVLPDQPVILMVSDTDNGGQNSQYQNGLYCHWNIVGTMDLGMKLSFLDFNIPSKVPDCAADGLVVYDKIFGNVHGPYCGAWNGLLELSLIFSSEIEIHFYSDTRPEKRTGGKVRARIFTAGDTDCDFYQMETATTPVMRTSCGVLLSPWFPGLVSPGIWTWLLDSHGDTFYIINVHYVQGPGIRTGTCDQFFRISEVSQDAGKLRQYESILLILCENTDLFKPKYNIKNPQKNRIYIELNTIAKAVYQRWEFKISYSTSSLNPPQFNNGPPGSCFGDYIYYRGSCYLYETWVLRHYQPEKYKYQTTWQGSEQRCQRDNATLVTIKDEDEADFIKYFLSTDWFWNPAASWQINHRAAYLGLTNRLDGVYRWLDNVQLAYSDWFQPGDPGYQSIVSEQEEFALYNLLGLRSPEPKPDSGSLCTIMIFKSPFGSLNWVKLPCDVPMFRAGVICKKDAVGKPTPRSVTDFIKEKYEESHTACPPGWLLVLGSCYNLYTNYTLVEASLRAGRQWMSRPPGMNHIQAEQLCVEAGGRPAGELSDSRLTMIKMYLDIWRHQTQQGDIWLGEKSGQCALIQVYRTHRMDENVEYRVVRGNCASLSSSYHPYNIICQMGVTERGETCVENEYTCGNGVCISVDFVCDGQNDCFDQTDEMDCPSGYRKVIDVEGGEPMMEAVECEVDKFRCNNGRCVSMSLFCDLVDNCGDNSDETNCVSETCGLQHFTCTDGQCIQGQLLCDLKTDCHDGTDELPDICFGNCKGFQCFSGLCIPQFLRHDIISDCPGLQLEDEIDKNRDVLTVFDVAFYENIVEEEKNETSRGCREAGQVECRPDYEICYDRTSTCVYDTMAVTPGDPTSTYVQVYCRDGSHLRTHCGQLECNGMFHCPSAYCLPYNKLCDGRLDCPGGEDEQGCVSYTCPGLFHCKGESFCLPHNKVCDGEINCLKYKEDEKYCGDKDVLCQDTCSCMGNIALCSNISLSYLPESMGGTRHLRSITLSSNYNLDLTNTSFIGLHWLGKLDLSFCNLHDLPEHIFSDLSNLYLLLLNDNKLSYLKPAIFKGLISLKTLNLHNNQIWQIVKETFSHLSNVDKLVLTQNSVTDMSLDAFDQVPTLRVLYSDAFKFCCIAKHVEECTPEPDEFSSCEDLMANYVLQISVWILGMFAFAGNIFVVIWRIKTDRKRVSSFFIINLGCSDFLMGVYMLIIASVDSYYRGHYIVYADRWRSSPLCSIAGILATLSSEVSVYMLTVITADRMFAILFPFKSVKFRMYHARIVVLVGWVACFCLSILPVLGIPFFGDSFYGRTGVCLPFEMNNDRMPGWEYSVAIFLVLNLISFIFIAIAYGVIFVSVSSSASRMESQASSTTDEYALAKKLMLIVVSDLLCWVPIILIGLAALGGARIPALVSAVIAVFVLPLNSAINPILYTISAIDCSRGNKTRRPGTKVTGKTHSDVISNSHNSTSQNGTSNSKKPSEKSAI